MRQATKQFAAQGSYNKRHEFFAKHKTSPLSFQRLRGFINIHPKSIDQSFLLRWNSINLLLRDILQDNL